MLLEGVCTSFIINFFLFSTTNKVGKYFRAGRFSKKNGTFYIFSLAIKKEFILKRFLRTIYLLFITTI